MNPKGWVLDALYNEDSASPSITTIDRTRTVKVWDLRRPDEPVLSRQFQRSAGHLLTLAKQRDLLYIGTECDGVKAVCAATLATRIKLPTASAVSSIQPSEDNRFVVATCGTAKWASLMSGTTTLDLSSATITGYDLTRPLELSEIGQVVHRSAEEVVLAQALSHDMQLTSPAAITSEEDMPDGDEHSESSEVSASIKQEDDEDSSGSAHKPLSSSDSAKTSLQEKRDASGNTTEGDNSARALIRLQLLEQARARALLARTPLAAHPTSSARSHREELRRMLTSPASRANGVYTGYNGMEAVPSSRRSQAVQLPIGAAGKGKVKQQGAQSPLQRDGDGGDRAAPRSGPGTPQSTVALSPAGQAKKRKKAAAGSRQRKPSAKNGSTKGAALSPSPSATVAATGRNVRAPSTSGKGKSARSQKRGSAPDGSGVLSAVQREQFVLSPTSSDYEGSSSNTAASSSRKRSSALSPSTAPSSKGGAPPKKRPKKRAPTEAQLKKLAAAQSKKQDKATGAKGKTTAQSSSSNSKSKKRPSAKPKPARTTKQPRAKKDTKSSVARAPSAAQRQQSASRSDAIAPLMQVPGDALSMPLSDLAYQAPLDMAPRFGSPGTGHGNDSLAGMLYPPLDAGDNMPRPATAAMGTNALGDGHGAVGLDFDLDFGDDSLFALTGDSAGELPLTDVDDFLLNLE